MRTWSPRLQMLPFWVLLLFGTWMTFGRVIGSGFTLIPTMPGDIRLVGYLLEHGFLWMSGDPLHARFWDVPMLFPLANVTAFTETFLGAAPFYWLPRLLGFTPEVSLDLWLIQMLALDFAVFAWFLRKTFGLSWIAASTGAYLFAFASIRLNQLSHAQLLPQFYTVLALHGLWLIVKPGTHSRLSGLALFATMTVAQLYAGFYLAWFWALSLSVALALALLSRPARAQLVVSARSLATPWSLVIVGGAAALLAPLAWHYLDAAGEVGMRSIADVRGMIPAWRSWINMGPGHWLYGRWYGDLIQGRLDIPWEHEIGLGLFTSLGVALGAWQVRYQAWARLFFGTALALALLSIRIGELSLWEVVFRIFPAAGAIRAVTRIALFMLVPAALGFALFTEALARKRQWAILACVVFALAAEQRVAIQAYAYEPIRAREAALRSKIGATCKVFLYTPAPVCRTDEPWGAIHQRATDAHLDAMWVSNRAGIPTLNGYSGSFPPGYTFWGLDYCGPSDDTRIPGLIRDWCHQNSCDPASICWVR